MKSIQQTEQLSDRELKAGMLGGGNFYGLVRAEMNREERRRMGFKIRAGVAFLPVHVQEEGRSDKQLLSTACTNY